MRLEKVRRKKLKHKNDNLPHVQPFRVMTIVRNASGITATYRGANVLEKGKQEDKKSLKKSKSLVNIP
jgi:hypothetical protein